MAARDKNTRSSKYGGPKREKSIQVGQEAAGEILRRGHFGDQLGIEEQRR